MPISDDIMRGGLTPEHDLVFAEKPADPEMRESTSMWLFEENGAFGFPRFGIEAEAASWENRRVQGNFAFAGGRVLNGAGLGAAHSPFGPDGRPTVLGAGPLSLRCIEPFRKWATRWDGTVADGTVDQQINNTFDSTNRIAVTFDLELTMAAPAWVQDYSPAKVALMSKADAIEAGNMGIGWRLEQLVRGHGTFTCDGATHDFNLVGSRIKRQSVRPMAGFRGHCWQSAIFPDGRGFGCITYPPREDGNAYNEAYITVDGKMYPAKVSKIPWLRRLVGKGDDVSLELESALGTTRIEGSTAFSLFRVGNPDIGGLNLQQGGVEYRWDGQVAFGMIERSSPEGQTAIG